MTSNNNWQPLRLIIHGEPSFMIVLPAKASEKEKAAATDLRQTFGKICGKEPVTDTAKIPGFDFYVLIGDTEYTRAHGIKKPSGYPKGERMIARSYGNDIVLTGNDDGAFTGTQFAVTALLEKIGCGWYGPDELWHVIPERKDVSVDYLDIDQTPQYVTRNTNVLRADPELARRWYMGGVPKVIGHALTGLVPRDEYFGTHPEWFCEIEGKRNPFVEWWQYCYSNEALTDLFAEKLISMFKNDPMKMQFSIAANDGWHHGWCGCDECSKDGSGNTERFLRFANRLAEKVAAACPDRILTLLAYFPTYLPPEVKMKMHPNIEIMFCKESDMFSPVDKGPDNGYHLKYEFPQSKNSYPVPWKRNFEKWLEMVECDHLAIWDWYCISAASPIWKDVPWVQGDVITRNHRYWSEHGVSYIYNDQGPLDVFYEDSSSYSLRWPLWYVHAKGMWDKDLTGSDILFDACRKLYGSAADEMFSFYYCLADIARNCTARSIAWHPPRPCEMYTDENVVRVDRVLDTAIAASKVCSETVKARVADQTAMWAKAKATVEKSKGL
ncbi:MAG: DUF4838 domain-containing protein [Saccharofermentanales bacterium]